MNINYYTEPVDITLDKHSISNPAPFTGWAVITGIEELKCTNIITKMKQETYFKNKKVFIHMPVRKQDKLEVIGKFEYGRFYEVKGVE